MIRGTLCSLRGLFRGRAWSAVWAEDHGTRLALLVALATVPTGIIGLGLKGPVERFMESGLYTSIALLFTGALLIATRWAREGARGGTGGLEQHEAAPGRGEELGALASSSSPGSVARPGPTLITPRIALLVGVAQGIAVFPGISRSGATLATLLLLGVHRVDGARFCFLLSVPAILGALVLEGKELSRLGAGDAAPVALGVGAAAVVGYLSLAMLVALVRRGRLHLFAAYVLPLGVLGILYFSLR
jgi:undecaprenyl-diphosphatase